MAAQLSSAEYMLKEEIVPLWQNKRTYYYMHIGLDLIWVFALTFLNLNIFLTKVS